MNRKINRDNYEAYLLDLLEGRLEEGLQKELREFLLMNPDCPVEQVNLEPWILEAPGIIYPRKDKLRKKLPGISGSLDESGFDLFSIARLEGDLTPSQEQEHRQVVEADSGKKSEWEEWKKTRLRAEKVLFPDRTALRKKGKHRPGIIWLSVVSAAAAAAILIAVMIDSGDVTDSVDGNRVTALPGPGEESKPGQKHGLQPNPTPPNESGRPATDASLSSDTGLNSAGLAILKRPDPPELTDKKMDTRELQPGGDSTGGIRADDRLIRPVRVALMDPETIRNMERGSYDRIRPIQVPPATIHLSSLSVTQLRALDLQEMYDQYTEENRISLLTLANLGIKGINRLTGADITLLASRDEEGELSGIRVISRRFTLSTPLDQSE